MLLNLILGVFNLIPGFPLDGGRVFRGLIWQVTGNYQRATAIMTPLDKTTTFEPDTRLFAALEKMGQDGTPQFPVVQGTASWACSPRAT